MRGFGLALSLCGTALAGCAGTVAGAGVSSDAEPSATSALLIVERNVDSTQGTRAAASARFVRVSGPSSMAEAMRAIGAAGDLPAPGMCATVTSLTGAVAGDEPAPIVELMDVGGVSLTAGGTETHLLPRQLPDVTDVVSGIVYARVADSAGLPAAARYAVHVDGRPDLAAFDASALAPADPSNIRIARESTEGTLVVAGEAPVDLSWAADGSTDVVYVDVSPAAVRCVLSGNETDDDHRIHSILASSFLDESGSLTVHRLHREPLHAPGLESGEIRFDFSRSISYVRSSATP